MSESPPPTSRAITAGIAGGALSGLFGVGGGIVMVPIFVLWLGIGQKRAITTSLVAIIPIAIAGTLGYAVGGAVDWTAALVLGVGSVAGGYVGARLLPHVPVRALQLTFAALLLYSAYRLVFPAELDADPAAEDPAVLMALVGVAAGILAGLLGIGGGIVLVPALVLLADASMNSARGTSLMVVVITACVASASNIARGVADTRTGVLAGLAGAPAALLASFVGQWIPQRQAAVIFAALMVVAAVQLVRRGLQRGPTTDEKSDG